MTTTVGAVVLTAAMVAEATGGRLVSGPADRVFEAVSTDSRAVGSEALFVALVGDRFDAHAFVRDALGRGATGLVVHRPVADVSHETSVIVVPDTLRALQDLARAVRRGSAARVVAITGSAGKTTTKEVMADLLATRYRVFRNRGNLNNHVGLPLSLLELRDGPDVAVVELGMNHAGEIRVLADIAEPDVCVWTNVGDAHLGHFGSRDAVARAKAELLERASAETLVVSNADDPLVAAHVRRATGRHISFGEGPAATVRALQVDDRGFDGTVATVGTPGGTLRLTVPLAGRAQLMNVLAAVAVAQAFGISAASIEATVATLRPVARRGAIARLANGARVIDDSYNASPDALRAMLAALAATAVEGRRVAVLGEMLELGASAFSLHEACGRAAVAAGVAELVVVGGDAADGLAAGATSAGLAERHVHRFVDSAAAARSIADLVRAGDLVLVKGSRGTRMDLVVDRLLEAG